MQAAGLARRLAHTHAKSAVIGLSGGLDSTLALLVAVRAMKKALPPSWRYSGGNHALLWHHPPYQKSNAQRLAEAYGTSFREVDITAAVTQHFSDIGQDPQKLDVTYENCQARERTQVLMDLANQNGGNWSSALAICRNWPRVGYL